MLSFFASLWPMVLKVLFFLVLCMIWRNSNYGPDNRYRQWWLPLVALLFATSILYMTSRMNAIGSLADWQPWQLLIDNVQGQLTALWTSLEAGQPDWAVRTQAFYERVIATEAFQGLRDMVDSNGWFGALMGFVNRNLSFALLTLFIVLKSILLFLYRTVLLFGDNRPRRPATVFYAYDESSKASYLRSEWFFSRIFFQYLAITLLVISILQSLGATNRFGWGYSFPVLALIILGESAWYFLGRLKETHPKLQSQDASLTGLAPVNMLALMDDYAARWPEWLLRYKTTWRSETEDAALETPKVTLPWWRRLFARNASSQVENTGQLKTSVVAIDASQNDTKETTLENVTSQTALKILQSLQNDRSVLIEDIPPLYLKDALGDFLTAKLIQGHKLLVIVDREDQIAEAKELISTLLSDAAWRVLDSQQALGQEPHVLLLTMRQESILFSDDAWISQLSLVMILDAHSTALWHGAEMLALLDNLRERMLRNLQLIVFSDWRVNSEPSLRNILRVADVDEFQLVPESNSLSDKSHYMLWRLEQVTTGLGRGQARFQDKLYSAINADIQPETALAVPALANGFQQVSLLGQNALPWQEYINEAENAARVGQLKALNNLDNTDSGEQLQLEQLKIVPNDWQLQPLEGQHMFIVRDESHNVALSLRKWLQVSDETFVQVVSPPYLYRDYFVAHLDELLNQPRRFSALAPARQNSVWSKVYSLYRRLELTWLPSKQIHQELNSIGVAAADVEESLRELFAKHLDVRVVNFDYKMIESFKAGGSRFGRFEKEHVIRLNAGQLGSTHDGASSWHERIDVESSAYSSSYNRSTTSYSEPELLASYFKGHLYQELLEGQIHAFAGKPYRITEITDDAVQVEAVVVRDYKDHYRQDRSYELKLSEATELSRYMPEVGSSRTRLGWRRLELPLQVQTHGYIPFAPEQSLNLSEAAYYPVSNVPERAYPHGKALELSLGVPSDVSVSPEQLSFSLCLLLNESFKTYFPEMYPFIVATSSIDASIFDDGTTASKRLSNLVPNLNLDTIEESENKLTLYFIEDSPFELGLLASLSDNLKVMLQELLQYVQWYLQDQTQHKGEVPSRYLHFGFEQLPEQIVLDEVIAILERL